LLLKRGRITTAARPKVQGARIEKKSVLGTRLRVKRVEKENKMERGGWFAAKCHEGRAARRKRSRHFDFGGPAMGVAGKEKVRKRKQTKAEPRRSCPQKVLYPTKLTGGTWVKSWGGGDSKERRKKRG